MPKIRQIVWLDYDTNYAVYQLAQKYRLAPNKFIAEVLRKILVEKAEFFQPPEEKKELDIRVACPICYHLFPDVTTVKKHIVKEHTVEDVEKACEELKALIKGEKQ